MKFLSLTLVSLMATSAAAFADVQPTLAVQSAAESPLPSRETGAGETVSTFMGLCVEDGAMDYRERLDRVRASGWTVFYEEQAVDEDTDELTAYEATASSSPGDTCSLHLTLEARENAEQVCEVMVSQFCRRDVNKSLKDTVLAGLSNAGDLALDLVSTVDENRRLQDHEHKIYRPVSGEGPLVRLADTGGTLYLSSVSTLAHE